MWTAIFYFISAAMLALKSFEYDADETGNSKVGVEIER